MVTYSITKHEIVLPSGECFDANIYSGHGTGLNNAAGVAIHDVGPIPPGLWAIGPPQNNKTTGLFSMPLTPVGHNALGRTAFFCHGDTAADMADGKELASSGCIVAPYAVRAAVWECGDRSLMVTP